MTISGAPISGAPISGSGPGGGPVVPTPPILGPSVSVDPLAIKYRFGESYLSEATNQKFLGVPPGVYYGFEPTWSGNVLTLDVDATYEVSLLRVVSQLDPTKAVDLYTDQPITLDFSSLVDPYPRYVVARADYSFGQPVSATILDVGAKPTTTQDVLICTLLDATTVLFNAPANRDTPYAWASAPLGYGFMRDGDVESLLQAIDLSVEVSDARVDLTGTTQGSLDTRIEADGTTQAMADRLAKRIFSIRSLEHATLAANSLNVSRSFANVNRIAEAETPQETLEPFGSETRLGAITAGTIPSPAPAGALSDDQRNVAVPVDDATGERLMDGDDPIFARLEVEEDELTGTITFNGTTGVAGSGTVFLTEVEAGDIIEDTGGNWNGVLSVGSDISLTLNEPALVSGAAAGLRRRRFVLNFFKVNQNTGNEDAVTVAAGTTIRFYFPAWRDRATPLADAAYGLYKHGHRAPTPVADSVTAGRVRLAAGLTSAFGGAVKTIQEGGSAVGNGDFHTLGFTDAVNAGSGVLQVDQRGPTGPPGAPGGGGVPGGPGPAGAPGNGFNTFEHNSTPNGRSADFDHSVIGGGNSYSFTSTFGVGAIPLYFASAGIVGWEVPAGTIDDGDGWDIQTIQTAGPNNNEVQIDVRVPLSGGSPNVGISQVGVLAAWGV